jgi:hypothetical protein
LSRAVSGVAPREGRGFFDGVGLDVLIVVLDVLAVVAVLGIALR